MNIFFQLKTICRNPDSNTVCEDVLQFSAFERTRNKSFHTLVCVKNLSHEVQTMQG